MYHKFGISKYPSTSVKIDQFDAHLKEFSKSKYSVESVEFIIDTLINDGKLPNNTIGISIDDADKSFYEVGWPKFKEMGFPVTLFVNTSTIHENNKNYLNWDQIRELANEGVSIGAHSHSHYHMADLSIDEVRDEIEISNNIFLKELGSIPPLFAFPYGEANEEIINLLKEYKFKVAFGQHSGVINETSNLYYLPRFSLNERYAEIDRVKFAANAKGLGIYDFIPTDPTISENPPYIGFSLLDEKLVPSIDCFVFDSKGQVEKELFKFNERIEIRLKRKLTEGRSRVNCTAKGSDNQWRWFGHQFYL
ncbi:polysaccharide deacetylase family protein [Alphaproteobacteria bacterium]|nr:polysaccharide deacetylase family protein [Alphaproteobacteria bacterium]MDC3269598.1 polysaccharide deacetylase family protein [Alphaproteobacteria bacterium]